MIASINICPGIRSLGFGNERLSTVLDRPAQRKACLLPSKFLVEDHQRRMNTVAMPE